MEKEIAVALIAAGTSLLASLYQVVQGQRNQREVEILKDRLTEGQADRDARRDYEYHALRRLYDEYEPLRFQLFQAAESAKHHIEELAEQERTRQEGREGTLPGGKYLELSTIYHLLLPAAVYRIICRNLTLVDLRLDTQIEIQYLLAKKAFLTLTDDARIAKAAGLDYTPYLEGWREKRIGNPQKYRRQGLPLGRLDNTVAALTQPLSPTSEHERVISFGEFEELLGAVQVDDVRSPLGAARDLFRDFHPERRPVLWRILLVQYFLYKSIMQLASNDSFTMERLLTPDRMLTAAEAESLRWHAAAKHGDNPGALTASLTGVQRYLEAAVLPEILPLIKAPASRLPRRY